MFGLYSLNFAIELIVDHLAGLSALLNPTLASAAATLTTALAAASNAVSNAVIPPPGLAIPQLGAAALPLSAAVASPSRLSSQF